MVDREEKVEKEEDTERTAKDIRVAVGITLRSDRTGRAAVDRTAGIMIEGLLIITVDVINIREEMRRGKEARVSLGRESTRSAESAVTTSLVTAATLVMVEVGDVHHVENQILRHLRIIIIVDKDRLDLRDQERRDPHPLPPATTLREVEALPVV